ncbi:hypothetical protein L6164_006703 [Bauhinia variegata]|uniref:Uncharacterized protein n=1 Tax=Bauhinia variegata TaxID=167791 RepID=A0ACB9PUQ6_BAUVA|nr:hypothetical protein L6164_006703 [Bauhinia variegata]
MEQPNPMKVLQVCTVTPPPQTITSTGAPTSLPLTFFDMFWLRFPPVECLFFYEFPHPTTSFFDSVLPKLKHSLSLTLQYLLPLTGNLTWPHHSPIPIISYVPGDGVSLTIAKSDADFNHIIGSNLIEALKFRSLIPFLSTSHEKASALALQITLFPNSGFSIGITTHHAILDGKTASSFLKSWAYICSKITESSSSFSPPLPENLIPFYNREVIRDPNGIGPLHLKEWTSSGGPNNRSLMVWNWEDKVTAESIRHSFELTPSDLQKLRESVASKLKNKSVRVSSFALTCAYAWACLVRAEQTKSKRVIFIINVDCRSRLEPPIPSTYFGNCVVSHFASAETKTLMGSDGFLSALEAISEALNGLEENGVLTEAAKLFKDNANPAEDRILSVAGSPRIGLYGIDFGWGRAKKVEISSIDKTGAFSLADSKNGNGAIELGLVLNKSVIQAFAALFAQGLQSL